MIIKTLSSAILKALRAATNPSATNKFMTAEDAGTLIYKDADNKYVQVSAETQISCEIDVRIIAESVQSGAVAAAAYAKGWFLASRLVCPIDLTIHADTLAKMDIVLM